MYRDRAGYRMIYYRASVNVWIKENHISPGSLQRSLAQQVDLPTGRGTAGEELPVQTLLLE